MSPTIYIIFGVYRLRPAVSFKITAVYQLRPKLLRVRTLVRSRFQISGITLVYLAAEGQDISKVPVSDFRFNTCVPGC